ncbi:MAG: hypothetical protein LUE11_07075 [Clostridia bacterium]|nr:hypothetical protein [Clostridia bacterium]
MESRYRGPLCTIQKNKNVVFCICQSKAINFEENTNAGQKENKNNYVLEVVQNYLMKQEESRVFRAFVFQDGTTSAVDFDQTDPKKIYYARYNKTQRTSLHHVLTMAMALLERQYRRENDADNTICIITSCSLFGEREKTERNCLCMERQNRWRSLPFKLLVISNEALSKNEENFLREFQDKEITREKLVKDLEEDPEKTLDELFA